MSRARPFALVVAAVLVAGYGYRAFEGVRAGVRFERARVLYSERQYESAAPLFDAAAIGFLRLRAMRLASESRLESWQDEVAVGGASAADPAPLVTAAEGFLACRCVAPASKRSWEGMSEVYDEMERKGREARTLVPFDPSITGWARVGRPGRISIGMIRAALELAPNWYSLLDDLAITFWSYGLETEAREAVRAAALSLPLFASHRLRRIPDTPHWVLDTFAEASRQALGQIPLLSQATHLTDLGKLEIERGRYALAIDTLTEAQQSRGDALRRAEIEFHLGLALLALGRDDEARSRFEASAENALIRPAALRNLALLAEQRRDMRAALDYLRRLRQEEPRNLDSCLEFARVARSLGEADAAIESLRWVRLIYPSDPRAFFLLAETHLDAGDLGAAAAVMREIERSFDDPAEIEHLRRRLEQAQRGG